MGGILIIAAVTISAVLWCRLANPYVWLAVFSLLYLGALGFYDDYIKVTKKKSDGLSGRKNFWRSSSSRQSSRRFCRSIPRRKTARSNYTSRS